MANKIQIRRGDLATLPTLDEGEFGFCIDAERLYIGNPSGSGNILMSMGPAGFDLGNGADGYVVFYTGQNSIGGDNDFFWDRENNRLGLRTDTPTHVLTVDGYITPATDNFHALGTPDQRWEALWLGPSSLHIHSIEAETGTSFDWRMGIDQTTGNEGNLIIAQGEHILLSMDPISSSVSFYSEESYLGDVIKIPEIASPPLEEAGFGKIYVASLDSALHFVTSGGTDYNLLTTGGTGNVDSSQGADGYVAFFIAPGHIAGDNDLFYNRESGDLVLGGGGKLGVGTNSPGSLLHLFGSETTLMIVEGDTAGVVPTVTIKGTDNTNQNSHSRLILQTGGTSAGDPFINFQILSGTNWYTGIDNTDSDKFKIGSGNWIDTSSYFVIDTSGQIGMGTDSPSAKLHLAGITFSAETGMLISGSSTNTNLASDYLTLGMTNTSATSNNYNKFSFMNSGGYESAGIAGIHTVHGSGTTSEGELVFLTRPAGAGIQERMRIDQDGKVGIGTNSPGNELDVVKDWNDLTRVLVSNQTAGTSALADFIALSDSTVTAFGSFSSLNSGTYDGISNANAGYIYTSSAVGLHISCGNSNGQIRFFTGNNNHAMTIDASQNIGIGIDSPATNLHLVKAGATEQSQPYFDTYSSGSGYHSSFVLRKSHQDTVGNTATVDGENIGSFTFRGNSGAGFTSGAFFKAVQNGAASTYTPANLSFWTSDGTNPIKERFTIYKDGEVAVHKDLIVGGNIINQDLTETFQTIRTALDGYGIGTGDVTKVGTPVDNQIGVWTGDGTIEGDSNLTWTGSQFIVQSASSTNSRFGSDKPIYLTTGWPNIGFNAYYDSGWKFGVGSSSSYASIIGSNTTGGGMYFMVSDGSGNADGAISLKYGLNITATGEVQVINDLFVAGAINNPDLSETIQVICQALDGYGAGTGDVTKVGTPANNQVAVWTGDGTLEGESSLTWNETGLGINIDAVYPLHVEKDATTIAYFRRPSHPGVEIRVSDTSGNWSAWIDQSVSGWDFKTNAASRPIGFFPNGVEALRLEGDGDAIALQKFGVGITPSYPIHVESEAGGSTVMWLRRNSSDPYFYYSITDTSGNWGFSINQAVDGLEFNIGAAARPAKWKFSGTERMRLPSTGELWLSELSSGVTPDSGFGAFYVKTDSKPYFKSDGGTEYDLTAASPAGSDGQIQYNNGGLLGGAAQFYYDDINNRVGIGTSSPGNTLQLEANADNSQHRVYLRNINSGTSSQVSFNAKSDHAEAGLVVFSTTNSGIVDGESVSDSTYFYQYPRGRILSYGGMYFYTNVPYQFAMSIASNKNIGIGTRFPFQELTVNGVIALQDHGTPTNEVDGYGLLYAKSDDKIYFKPYGQAEIDLTSGGGGTPAGSDAQIQYNNGGSFGGAAQLYYDDVNDRVGIGTSSPDSKLHIQHNASGVGLFKVETTSDSLNPVIAMQDSSPTQERVGAFNFLNDVPAAVGQFAYFFADHHMRWNTNAATRMTLSSVGNLRIGATDSDAAARLHIERNNVDILIDELSADNTFGAISMNSSMVATSYALASNGTQTFINGTINPIVPDSLSVAIRINNSTKFGVAHTGLVYIGEAGGILSPHETLTVNGAISLKELSNITRNHDGYGTLYAKSSDSKIYWRDDSGTEYDLTSGGSGGGVSETTFEEHKNANTEHFQDILKSLDGYASVTGGTFGDGYVLFFTGPTSVAGDNDLFWDRVNNRLGIGTETPEEKLDVAGTIVADALKARHGALDGYVLTSDADGYGTWKDPAIMFERLVVTEDGRLVLDGDGNPTYISLPGL